GSSFARSRPSSSMSHGGLTERDIRGRGNTPDCFADHIQGRIVDLLNPDASLPHVQLLARFLPSFTEPLSMLIRRAAVVTSGIQRHEVKGHVIFLGSQGGERQRLLGVAMIAF